MASPSPEQDPAIQEAVSDVESGVPTIVKDVQSGNIPGGIIEGVDVGSKVAALIPTIIQETKAGYKTTEFWSLIAWEIISETEVAFHLPGVWAKLAAGLGPLITYILSRGIAKHGVPNQAVVQAKV